MKMKPFFWSLVAVACFVWLPGWAAGGDTTQAPELFFPEPQFQFEPVLEGEKVKHTYRVANKGNAPLNIQKVKTG